LLSEYCEFICTKAISNGTVTAISELMCPSTQGCSYSVTQGFQQVIDFMGIRADTFRDAYQAGFFASSFLPDY
jgi:hypothetical protein